MVDPAELAGLNRAYVIAAAGCGKTELIADSAGVTSGRSLVLTHTHAGVGALRARLRRKEVPPTQCSVETLDGFALRFAASYPETSGWANLQPAGGDWNSVREAAIRWLATPTAEKVLTASYDGVFVDEYQDCTVTQHRLVMQLAQVLPMRLLGDPLQGIFGFAGDLLDWSEVYREFAHAGVLETPHRWVSTNPELGEWLLDARHRLEAGQDPDWSSAIVATERWSVANEIAACQRLSSEDSVVAIRKHVTAEHQIASKLGGRYVSMEPIAAKSLFEAVAELEDIEGFPLALATIDIAARCMTKVNTSLRSVRRRLEAGELPTIRAGTLTAPAAAALAQVVELGISKVADALDAIESMPEIRVHRVELLEEIRRAVRSRTDGSTRPLKDVAWDLRDDARRRGREVPPRVVSRTLLVKGLEFDHGLVLKRTELSTNDLYVAITRPRHSLTVLL